MKGIFPEINSKRGQCNRSIDAGLKGYVSETCTSRSVPTSFSIPRNVDCKTVIYIHERKSEFVGSVGLRIPRAFERSTAKNTDCMTSSAQEIEYAGIWQMKVS